jgi:N-acetylmuramoyl-L-alanine amidase
MLTIAWYLLKVTICSGVLLGYYWLALRNKVFHHYNRFYLLLTIILSALLPFIEINFWHNNSVQSNTIKVIEAVSYGNTYVNDLVINAAPIKKSFNWPMLCPIVYFFITILLSIGFIKMLFQIRTLLKKYPAQKIDNVTLVNTNNERGTPFSFLRYIFWNSAIDTSTKQGNQIFKHELAHIKEKHTYDKLFINIVLIIFWFNPFFWLLRKELNLIHEFIADKKAVGDGDTSGFAAMLLQTIYPQHQFSIANNFFYSPIKRRLLMITKIKNQKANYIGRILVLPLSILILAAFTFKVNKSISHLYKGKKITVVIDAGHGGERDPGAKSSNGISEKDICLSLANYIKTYNTNTSITIELVREGDVYLSPVEKAKIANDKNADLFVSLHLDGSPHPNTKTGMSIWIAKNTFINSEKSKLFAASLITEFEADYPLAVAPIPVQRQQGIWVLQNVNAPSVLIEAGNITNDKDVVYLQTTGAKETIAKNILMGIEKFLILSKKSNPQANKISTADSPHFGMFINTNHADTNYFKTDAFKNRALVIVDGKEIGNFGDAYLEKNSANFNSSVIYNIEKARKIYGEKGQYGVIKLTLKDAAFTTAKSVFFDEQNNLIKFSGNNTIIKGDLSKVLIYIDGKISTQGDLNKITAGKINNIAILESDKLDEIIDVKGKTALIDVSLKADDLPEVVINSFSANRVLENENHDTIIFTKTEIPPSFPGGNEAWRNFLLKNLNGNTPVNEGWKAGTYTVIVQFIVHGNGSISNIITTNFKGSKTAEHCIELIKKSTQWTPAIQNGKKVAAYCKQPIVFVIDKDKNL